MESSARPKLEPRTFPSRIADLGFRMEVPPDWVSHPINANLRDRGVGLVPNVVGVDEAGRFSSVAAGSILAKVDVPFGWHAIDDGKRLLVFEPKGQVQIHMSLILSAGRSPDGILDEIETQARADYPDPQFIRVENGGIRALGIRNIADGDQPLEQYHLVRGWRDDSMVLRSRVTSTPDRAVAACNLAGLMLEGCDFDFGRATPPTTREEGTDYGGDPE